MRWLPNVRALLTAARALQEIARQLRRIADHLDGVEPPVPPMEPTKPFEVAPDTDWRAVDATRARLAETLGREPTDEEIVRELDGEEYAGDEPTLHPATRRMRETGHVQ